MTPSGRLDQSGSRWFAHPADPMGPLSEYQGRGQRVGMSHPPQNAQVQKDLLEYFAACGIAPPNPSTPHQPAPGPSPLARGAQLQQDRAAAVRSGLSGTTAAATRSAPSLPSVGPGQGGCGGRRPGLCGPAAACPTPIHGRSYSGRSERRGRRQYGQWDNSQAVSSPKGELGDGRPLKRDMTDGELDMMQSKLRWRTRAHRQLLGVRDPADMAQLGAHHNRSMRGPIPTMPDPLPALKELRMSVQPKEEIRSSSLVDASLANDFRALGHFASERSDD
mmetsp:Transcript_63738/g.137084  ORF Transcript_63738/g.137084 Transcript_63738/m.137084 type:complete len:277 (+) Transcript_63738:150-980(+)